MPKVEVDEKLVKEFVNACVKFGVQTIREMAEKINEKETE